MTETVLQHVGSGTRVSIYDVETDGGTGAWRASGFLIDPTHVWVHPHQAREVVPDHRLRVAIQYLYPATHPVEVVDVDEIYRKATPAAPPPDHPVDLVILRLDRDAYGPPEPWFGTGPTEPGHCGLLRDRMIALALSHPPLPHPASIRRTALLQKPRRKFGCNPVCVILKGRCKCKKKD